MDIPANVPAVLEMPIKMPAYFGAISIWFTENPPLAKPAKASALVVADTPVPTSVALDMNMSAMAAPTKPALSLASAELPDCTLHNIVLVCQYAKAPLFDALLLCSCLGS